MKSKAVKYLDISSGNKDSNFGKEKDFYKYLLRNGVAYYYATQFKKNQNTYDKKIIQIGNRSNVIFEKTLKLIDRTCKLDNIKYCLIKTYKYIHEAYFGDIDLVIKPDDLLKMINIFQKFGFSVNKENAGKYELIKTGYTKIEIRSEISYHGFVALKSSDIWKNTVVMRLFGTKMVVTSLEFDVAVQLLNVLYGPKYIDMYLYMLIKKANLFKLKRILNEVFLDDVNYLIQQVENISDPYHGIPFFLRNSVYLKWWYKRILLNKEISFYEKIRHFLFFFISKYQYLIFGSLYFEKKYTFL